MSSTTGIKDGDFDRINIAFDLGVGLDNDFGTNGQVLISGGENEPVRWGSNSAVAPNPLRQGTNTKIVKTSDGTDLGTYDGSIDATIKTTDDISADEIKTDKLILPKVGTEEIELDGSTGEITGKTLLMNGKSGTTTAVFTGDVNINVSTDQDGDLSVAGDYSSLNGNITLTNGTITAGGLISGGSLTTAGNITATGTSGFVGVGTNADTYNILLNKDGTITCEDINLESHTGIIEFNQIRCNDIGVPKTGTKTNYLNSDGLFLTGSKDIDAPLSQLDIKNIVVRGGLSTPNSAIICLGGLETGTDGSGNLGSILLGSGNLTLDTGNINLTAGDTTLTAGDLLLSSTSSTATFSGDTIMKGGAEFRGNNSIDFIDSSSNLNMRISPDTGNITNPVGKLTLSKAGTTPAPTDNTYTDWALNISNDDGHGYIGGNLIVNGKIYADVEGSITEEEIDAQRLTLRTATPPLSGITGMILGSGAIISNDTTGLLELTIDADLSGMVINNISVMNNTLSDTALAVVGNTTLSSGDGRTTTIGSVGSSGQTLEVLCNNVNLGETAGNQQNNTLNYRGGIHNFTGEKVDIGDRLGFTNVGCSLEGSSGQATNNIYRNNVRFFNFEGKSISHDLAGTIQNFVILRGATARTIQVAKQTGFSNTSTVFTLPDTYYFEDVVAPTSVAKIDFDLFFRHRSGVPDLYVRIDSTSAGATPYNSTTLTPRILVNTAFGGAGNEIRITHSYFIVGLTPGDTYSFYPKFADTTGGSAIGDLKYGGAFGEMSLKLTWLEAYLGVSGDPYAPATEEDY